MKITKSAKAYAKKIYIDLKSDLLYADELREFIIASVKYDKDNSFHNEKYYDMLRKLYITCMIYIIDIVLVAINTNIKDILDKQKSLN